MQDFKEMFEKSNSTTTQVQTPDVTKVLIKTEAKAVVIAPSVEPHGEGMSIALLEAPKPKVRNAFVSNIVIETTARRFGHKMSYKHKFVPGTDKKTSSLEFLKFLLAVMEDYDGIVVGIQNNYVPEDRNMKTDPAAAGFDIRGYITSSVHADEAGEIMEAFRQSHAPRNLKKPFLYSRHVSYHGHRFEAELIRALQRIEEDKLYDIRDWHSFNRLWDSNALRLTAIDEKVIFEKRRIWMDHSFHNYRVLCDADPAFANVAVQLVRSHVRNSFRITRNEDSTALSEIFKTVRMSRNVLTRATGIATEIMRANGVVALRELAVLMQMNRWGQGDISLSLSSPSVPTIIGLLMIKVFTPEYIWRPHAVLMMHNYLAKFLVTAMPNYKGPATIEDFDFEEDQLKKALTRSQYWTNGTDLTSPRRS